MSALIELLALRIARLSRRLNTKPSLPAAEEKIIIAELEDTVGKMKDALATRH